jgi:hypothetical protein
MPMMMMIQLNIILLSYQLISIKSNMSIMNLMSLILDKIFVKNIYYTVICVYDGINEIRYSLQS